MLTLDDFLFDQILFYCLKLRDDGIAKITSAASKGHTEATYALAVILFNGSGGAEVSRDIPAAVALCQQAASNGHVIALRELGFCTHDGYGISEDHQEGHRLVDLAKSLEMAEALDRTGSLLGPVRHGKGGAPHIANRFMVEWFKLGNSDGLDEFRMCSNAICGRQETRAREFRCCAVCTTATYCSRACRSRHWMKKHRMVCYPH
jgi:TPR repeat protein